MEFYLSITPQFYLGHKLLKYKVKPPSLVYGYCNKPLCQIIEPKVPDFLPKSTCLIARKYLKGCFGKVQMAYCCFKTIRVRSS
jgi:hypothetical protein